MHTNTTIFLIEDEPALGRIIKESLETKNFKVHYFKNGKEAFDAYLIHKPALLVIDVMLPIKDGLTLTKEIRAIDTHVPIILLTAKSQTKDVIAGFEVGCNDYIRKPFSIEELIVRIYALLNKPNKAGSIDREVSIGAYLFSASRQTLKFGNQVFSLTHRESSLLQLLMEHRNEVVNRFDILQKIWNNDNFFCGPEYGCIHH